MALVNEHYLKLAAGYLFPEIGRRVNDFVKSHPGKKVIRMGIGDVTQPLAPAVIKAFHEGVDEMARKETFKGYGPEQGYEFLREAIAEHAFRSREPPFLPRISLSPTGRNAIREIFRKSSETKIELPSAIRSIRCMPTRR